MEAFLAERGLSARPVLASGPWLCTSGHEGLCRSWAGGQESSVEQAAEQASHGRWGLAELWPAGGLRLPLSHRHHPLDTQHPTLTPLLHSLWAPHCAWNKTQTFLLPEGPPGLAFHSLPSPSRSS